VNIRPRDRDAVISALRAGVVPKVGQHLIQVGRSKEIEALLADLDRVAAGGSLFRLIIGEYGSGKTFFLNLVRSLALEKKLVVANADLNPDRRLHASGGQARSLYAELMKSLATRTRPEGGALNSVVEKLVSTLAGNAPKDNPSHTEQAIRKSLEPLSDLVGGYDFVEVIVAYWRGFQNHDDGLQSHAVRWLRGEFATKTEARAALGVRTIIEDSSFYDQLKVMARFTRLAGYGGLLVCLDEMVNLYKLTSSRAREANYEQILRILNDVLQHPPEGFGVLMGGTPEFLSDPRRGLYSYPALQRRLTENTFAREGLVDYTGPVLKLGSLSPEELYVLLQKLRLVFVSGDESRQLIPDEGLTAFMSHCQKKLGETYFRTPGTTITSFVNLLAVLDQNPQAQWSELVGQVQVRRDQAPAVTLEDDTDVPQGKPSNSSKAAAAPGSGDDDELTSFKL
jgi:hypothetical protein